MNELLSHPHLPLLIVPGWRNSGPAHWQSHWQRQRPSLQRVDFGEWVHPTPRAWTAILHHAVKACAQPPLLIAHSLGCLATANLLGQPDAPAVAGVMLVAPPDPGRVDTPPQLNAFNPPARSRFSVPGFVVISSNDIYAEESFSLDLAAAWGLDVVRLGPCGHINAESGFGPWPGGLALLDGLLAQIVG